MGAVMMKTGAYNTLELMSKEEGRHMDSPDSIKVICYVTKFVKETFPEYDSKGLLLYQQHDAAAACASVCGKPVAQLSGYVQEHAASVRGPMPHAVMCLWFQKR